MSVYGTPTLGQNFQYSTDGENWTEFTPGSTTVTLTNTGDKVYFKGDNPNGVNESYSIRYTFVMTGSIAGSGNIMSLIDNGDCTTLTIPNSSCYDSLFSGCTSLTTAPDLPATTLTNSCYISMFQDCTSLTSAPDLPATTLTSYCYGFMFQGCTSLTTAPNIAAASSLSTTYAVNMFKNTGVTGYESLDSGYNRRHSGGGN